MGSISAARRTGWIGWISWTGVARDRRVCWDIESKIACSIGVVSVSKENQTTLFGLNIISL
jgi:hypothetical protein